MEKTIRAQLLALADEEYRKFAAGLIPNIDNMLGVRLPELRKLAKHIAGTDWRAYMAKEENDYFEEVMLQGMVIGYAEADVEERLRYIAGFVPKIDNWSVCDSFCSGLKFTRTNKQRVWAFLQAYLLSANEYDVRFGVVMLLLFYAEAPYIEDVLRLLDQIRHDGYYVKMAVAWAVSVCYVQVPERTGAYLTNNSLDDFTYNKALQKIVESRRVDPETKARLRGMRRSSASRSSVKTGSRG